MQRQRKLVLLAEDVRQLRELAARALRRSGYAVVEAGSGPEAEELAKKHGPDLAVVDIAMTQLGGLEAPRRLGTPVIFMSAGFDQIDLVRARVADALAA
jgi:CheY-like chemotaxis protein